MDDMHDRLRVLQARHGANGLLGLLTDVLYERGQLGEVLDDVDRADAAMRKLHTTSAPMRHSEPSFAEIMAVASGGASPEMEARVLGGQE